MTHWCIPDQITQQPGDANVRILTEIVSTFKNFGDRKLIRELSDKGWNVKSLNKFFKEVAGFRYNDKTNGKRSTSQCAF